MTEQLTASEKLELTCEMFELGVEMMRKNLKRRFPQDDDEAIERRLEEWLLDRKCAPHGDSAGRPVSLSRIFGNEK